MVQIYYTDQYELPLPTGHTFPMSKYPQLRGRVQQAGLVAPHELLEPPAVELEEITTVHDSDYVRRVIAGELCADEVRKIGFPWSVPLVQRSRRSSGATLAAARHALSGGGVGINLAGGTHHAFRDRGEGYCLFNDSAIAACVLRREGRLRRVLIIDTDVHQGNGTAAIFADQLWAYTFSIHGGCNYPLKKEASCLDIHLADRTGDETYLAALEAGIDESFRQARPDLVLWVAGADAYGDDRLGRLALTKTGLAERDRLVLDACWAAGVPVVVSMAGGYARNVTDTVDIHFATVAAAVKLAAEPPRQRDA